MTQPTVDEVIGLIRERGGRASRAGRKVIESLTAAAGDHRTAEEVADEVRRHSPDIHPATIYRNLERLEALGVAYHTHLGHGPAQWHLVAGAHPHLTCERCGHVIEAPVGAFDALRSSLWQSTGFRVDLRHFALTGTCAACVAQER
ncbi:MAG: transcriptional repressor [Acidimicrobiales bacterium]|nr:transcriptional repressor [Acidimicrobiales bacterium]